jgi:SAM-dependent methyltransferase
MDEPIYHLPEEYDLEHAGPAQDIGFYVALVFQWRPARILELGCGTGRVTLPLAMGCAEFGPQIVGLERVPEMLVAARAKAGSLDSKATNRVRWIEGDLRHWRDSSPFDLIIAPCGTLSHLLSLDDQLGTWSTAFQNLNPGGRFIADVAMADLRVLAESMHQPPRATLELDSDTSRPAQGGRKRLLRYKAVRYDAREQCATVHYLYDQFQRDETNRFLSDYEHHVYYPRELELLFRMTGFCVESIWGDYQRSPLQNHSNTLVMVGVRS